jgi:hypothetical protein
MRITIEPTTDQGGHDIHGRFQSVSIEDRNFDEQSLEDMVYLFGQLVESWGYIGAAIQIKVDGERND